MNIIYKITFTKRKDAGIMPHYYIGSKTNCRVEDGIILSGNKEYWGSAKTEGYNDFVNEDHCIAEVLYEGPNAGLLIKEKEFQVAEDAVRSPKFFNRAYATDCNFTDPNYASYKHIETGKVIRLLRNDPIVLDGTYVGVTKGTVLTEKERKSRGRGGELNAFYGKVHSDKTKERISEANSGREKSEAEITNWVEKVAKKPKSKEHRAKIGRPGLIMLKNKDTNECIRIPKETKDMYDSNVWWNPGALAHARKRNDQV